MGEVYLGESRAGELVAVKVIRTDLLGDLETRLRFVREVEALKTVTGTRVAPLIDADPEAEEPWLVTQYVHGPNLEAYVKERGTLAAELVAILGAMLAEGLRSIELVGLLHRDLKPQNVVLGPDGPVVIDFGLAVMAERRQTLTAVGVPVGTVTCMSPEQALGERELTTAADVYGLGATLLYAATGRYPYELGGYAAMITRITNPELRPNLDGVPEELRALLDEMLRHDPDDRPRLKPIPNRLVAWIEREHGLSALPARRRLIDVTAAGVPPLPEPAPEPLQPDADPGTTQAEGTLGEVEAVASDERGQVPPDRDAAQTVADRLGEIYARRATLRRPPRRG